VARNFRSSDRVRVLVNGIHAKSGGGVTYLRNILPLLAEEEDFEIHLFIHKDQFKLYGILDERVHTHVLEYPNGFFSNLLWEQLALPILAKVMSVDVTLSPANYGPLLAPRQIIVLRNSLAVVGRETRLLKRLYWIGLALMTTMSLMFCRRAVAVSGYAKKALTFGMPRQIRNKVTVIHHGITNAFVPGHSTQRRDFLLAVSDIYIQKNLHNLIHALAIVREKFPQIRLKIAGRAVDAGYLTEIESLVEKLELEEAVEFLGHKTTDELIDLYQTCRLFVFPSTVETFGNPLVEAMACGAPIACSGVAAMPEIVGDAALLFSPLDPSDIAAKIIRALEDEECRSRLSELSIQRAKAFSWRSTAHKLAIVIREIAPPLERKFHSAQARVTS